MTATRVLLTLIVAAATLVIAAGDGLRAGKRDRSDRTRTDAAQVATPGARAPGDPEIALVLVARGLADPVAVAAPDDQSGRLFVAERDGRIRVIDRDGDLLDEPFLDVSAEVQAAYMEQGLLGIAFHPSFKTNGRLFVAYTDFRTNGDTFIKKFRVSDDDPNRADPDSGRLLLAVDQSFVEHNGGTLQFGPDGYLYIGMVDGGHGGDPYDYAQDRGSLLGNLLRIDVDGSGELPYGIPEDNPFAGLGRTDSPFGTTATPERERRSEREGRSEIAPATLSIADGRLDPRQEIWALGLRNPWQFAFDPATGDLFIPDAGQRRWEEINRAPAGAAGGANFGWDWLEATHCYPEDMARCPRQQVGELPIAEYEQGDNGCAIVGIGVYRGNSSPELDGAYFHSDFCTDKVWSLKRHDDGTWRYVELLDAAVHALGSGQDAAGELYLTTTETPPGGGRPSPETLTGAVWRIVAADSVPDGVEVATTDSP